MKIRGLSTNQLDGIRRETNKIVPSYYLTQFDTMEALDTAVGNCFSKAMVACGLIVLKHNVEPSLVYKESVHGEPYDPKYGKPKDPQTGKVIAHVSLVVPSPKPEVDRSIPTLMFGVEVYQGKAFNSTDRGEVQTTFNLPEHYVELDDQGLAVPTAAAQAYGMHAGGWREIAPAYLDAMERRPLDVDLLLSRLVEQDFSTAPNPRPAETVDAA